MPLLGLYMKVVELDMVKSLLPPLNDDHAVAIPSTHGKWTVDENSILGRIANGLKDITIEQEVEDLIYT